MNKLLKLAVLGFAAVSVVGCASVGSVANKMVNNKSEGIIYGMGGIGKELSVEELCKSTQNKDSRCLNISEYVAVSVIAKVGFADGAVGIYALADKNIQNLDLLKHSMRTGNKNAPYVKAKVVAGQLGELLEVMPAGACKWSGMPRAGGTVCAGLYDYNKDYVGVVFK
ncbi:MAG TPA: hypothetical protein PK342_02935 [Methylotenera sp.]|nr:hypothetical protein [Methylotenera sp.]